MIEVDPTPRLPVKNMAPGDRHDDVMKMYRVEEHCVYHVLSDHYPSESELENGDLPRIEPARSFTVTRAITKAEENAAQAVPRAALVLQDPMDVNNHLKLGRRFPPPRKGVLYNRPENFARRAREPLPPDHPHYRRLEEMALLAEHEENCNIRKARVQVAGGARMRDHECDCFESVRKAALVNYARIKHYVDNGLDFHVEDPVIPADAPRILFQNKNEQGYWHNFSSYSGHQVEYKKEVYPTAEHLYQSFKFQDHKIVEAIRTCGPDPSKARELAHLNRKLVRKDWLVVQTRMRDMALIRKFAWNENLKKELLATGDAELVYNCTKDTAGI